MSPPSTPIALTIAGSDSSGGAGIQADLKTFSAFSVYGASVLTALTAQNTTGVHGVHTVPAAFVTQQINAVLSDLDVRAIKTGMLANTAIVVAVVDALAAHADLPVIVDPVMVATSGDVLLDPAAIDAVRRRLMPIAALATPNLAEAARLLDTAPAATVAEMTAQAHALMAFGCRAVLLKGGHGAGDDATDVLLVDGSITVLTRPRISTTATHGTGCTLSAAITALMASGVAVGDAVERAKSYVWQALNAARDLGIGAGCGPLDHLYAIRRAPSPT